jgi:hypothetical protein
MNYREILVHVKAYGGWSPHIDVALEVARACGARLTALYTIRELAMLRLVLGAQSNAVKEAAARDRPLAADYERKFREAAAKAGVEVSSGRRLPFKRLAATWPRNAPSNAGDLCSSCRRTATLLLSAGGS